MIKNTEFEVDVTLDHEVFSGGNDPAASENFRDLALGMFIHWSIDSPLGLEISHSMIGASEKVLERYLNELPRNFNPRRFDPEDYAILARDAGMKYCCFTTKHHGGFCMFDTQTTSYNVMNTPYGRDITRMFFDTFRRYGQKIGVYFSPLDFSWLHRNGIPLRFLWDSVIPANNPGLMDYNQAQMAELLHNYGKIDMVFFDGPPEGLKKPVWMADPETVITRGEMPTPEMTVPDAVIDQAWEGCYTLGAQWNYHPQMLARKTARQVVELLIETRAKGGNLLLNVSPAPDGTIPVEQEKILRELGLWLFWHREAIYEVRPYRILNEDMPDGGKYWFVRSKNGDTIYVFIVDDRSYDRGTRREFLIRSLCGEKIKAIELLGQNGIVLEHAPPELDATTHWRMTAEGCHVDAMRCLRPCDSMKYDFPYVLEIKLER